jgi:hypothetical protein
MTGAMLALGPCFTCKRVFGFHPDLVCSVVICRCKGCGMQSPPDLLVNEVCPANNGGPHMAEPGRREPLCRDCVERINVQRSSHGQSPMEILPGAYPDMELE